MAHIVVNPIVQFVNVGMATKFCEQVILWFSKLTNDSH
jgi:hypothetical protein